MAHPVLSLLDGDERMERIERSFRNVARSEDGLIVFLTMFEEMGLFDTVSTEGQLALNNYAKRILARIGINDSYVMTRALFNTIKEDYNA